MQNNMAMQWQPKNPKERNISESNVIGEESTENFENIQLQKEEGKHHPGATIVHLRRMLQEIGELLSKYQIITILLLHLRCIQCIDFWMIPGVVVVTVL